MRMRPYQVKCVDAINDALSNKMSTLAVLATGLGKTVVFSHVAKNWPGRVLVLAHRDELIQQAIEKLHAITGEDIALEMGDWHIDEDAFIKRRIVVSSVQTMMRPKRQRKFRPCEFGLVIIDEAHHAIARSYRDVITHFRQSPTTRVLGVTATPKRADQLAMGQVFESVAFDYGIEPAIDDGWLVPVRQQAVYVEGLDFSKVRSVAGDLSESDLQEIVSKEEVLHRVVAPTVEIAGDLPALVFCVSVSHAEQMAAMFGRYKLHSAKALSGKTPRPIRLEVINQFKRGEIQFLCNCGLFLEGFDAPTTAMVVMARPTKSLALYCQVLGRGTRPLPGVVDPLADATPEERRKAIAESEKPYMMVLDFVGNSGRHKIINATDLLGGKYGEPVRAYAAKTAADEAEEAEDGEGAGASMLVEDRLVRAKDELLLVEEMEERRRLAEVKARAEFIVRETSPFGPNGPKLDPGAVHHDPPTEKQGWFLVKKLGWSWPQVKATSKRQASAIIGKYIEQHRRV